MGFREHLHQGKDYASLAQTMHVAGEDVRIEWRGNTDDWMMMAFPNPVDLENKAGLLAAVANRDCPYELDRVGDFDMLSKLVTLADGSSLDIAEVALLYENDPALYVRLLIAAKRAIGEIEDSSSGLSQWLKAYNAVKAMRSAATKQDAHAAMMQLRGIVADALRDFYSNDRVEQMLASEEEGADWVMELALGKSEGGGESEQALSTGA